MSQAKIFGHIPGVSFGSPFTSRKQLHRAGVHGHTEAGIHGDAVEGAYSICVSGGYDDDEDNGETITYVGSGGRVVGGNQTADQSMDDTFNKSLYISSLTKRPVRVIRGANRHSFYSPQRGYRYDGLYVVDSAEMKTGKKGFQMCFFQLRRLREEGDKNLPTRRLLDTKKMMKIFKQSQKKN